ncbi:MAG: putative toxin-antitoxin system toxin component, PIN family [Chloroflexi bacterium]|nr:putative toxin-antitoxin system toxin component, PIN family [Chloroflexota bacterium]
MRVVLDANVLVSALISPRGATAQLLQVWEEGRLPLLISEAILRELDRVLHYPKLQERYRLPEGRIARFLQFLRTQGVLVEPIKRLSVIERDPTDDRYLECAVAGEAQIIVSGDKHLLELGTYQGIQILSPAGFLAFLRLGP